MAADPLAVRAYRSVVADHEKNVARAIRAIRNGVAQIGDGVSDPAMSLGSAQRMAVEVAELVTHLSALKALREVGFLTEEER